MEADAEAQWVAAMRRGDFAAAYAISDQVLAGRDPRLRDDPLLPYHRRWVWDGRTLDGADVRLTCSIGGTGKPFRAARRVEAWRGNCVALGAAAGLLEPLHPTALTLLLRSLAQLIQLWPAGPQAPVEAAAFNRTVAAALHAIHRGMDASIDDGLAIEEAAFARIVPTADAQEGVAAFVEKREPRYTGR